MAAGALYRLSSIGKPFTFNLTDVNDKTVSSRNLRGKYLVLHFWNSNAKESIARLRELSDLTARVGREHLSVVAVCWKIHKFQFDLHLEANGFATNVFELQGHEMGLAAQFGIFKVPTTILIDKDGIVKDTNVNIDQLKKLERDK